jgi:hypothetical protein
MMEARNTSFQSGISTIAAQLKEKWKEKWKEKIIDQKLHHQLQVLRSIHHQRQSQNYKKISQRQERAS